MPLRNIRDLGTLLPPSGPLLGLDVGEKTIGLALSDRTRLVGSPLETIRRTKFTADTQALAHAIAVHDAVALVIGLPINMDGSEGPRCQAVRAFAREFLRRVDVEAAFWDERLSTAAVTRTMLEADLSRARRHQIVDKLAAAYILQGALDFLAQQPR